MSESTPIEIKEAAERVGAFVGNHSASPGYPIAVKALETLERAAAKPEVEMHVELQADDGSKTVPIEAQNTIELARELLSRSEQVFNGGELTGGDPDVLRAPAELLRASLATFDEKFQTPEESS